jgi:hypothetical protein
MVIFSGSLKLMKNESAVHVLTQMGVADYITLLGAMEIVFTILFIFPNTMKIGFILLSCYFAGAMATELSHNGSVFKPVLPIALVWIAAFLRDASTFLPQSKYSGTHTANEKKKT